MDTSDHPEGPSSDQPGPDETTDQPDRAGPADRPPSHPAPPTLDPPTVPGADAPGPAPDLPSFTPYRPLPPIDPGMVRGSGSSAASDHAAPDDEAEAPSAPESGPALVDWPPAPSAPSPGAPADSYGGPPSGYAADASHGAAAPGRTEPASIVDRAGEPGPEPLIDDYFDPRPADIDAPDRDIAAVEFSTDSPSIETPPISTSAPRPEPADAGAPVAAIGPEGPPPLAEVEADRDPEVARSAPSADTDRPILQEPETLEELDQAAPVDDARPPAVSVEDQPETLEAAGSADESSEPCEADATEPQPEAPTEPEPAEPEPEASEADAEPAEPEADASEAEAGEPSEPELEPDPAATDAPPAIRARAFASVDVDAAAGKAARKRAPRRRSGAWDSTARTAPALDRLRAQEAVRDHGLLPIRYARMASSPWAYLRGAAAVMAADLATAPHSGLTVQMCGDAHILNFGLWASPERQLLFDARDFDETLPGPFEWDLKRLVTSIFVLADTESVSPSVARTAATAAVEAYVESMQRYADMGELEVWYDHITAAAALENLAEDTAEGVARNIRRQTRKRSQEGAVRKLTEEVDGELRIIEDPLKRRRFSLDDDAAVRIYESVFDTYLESIPAHLARLVGRFRRIDSVQQVVGVGSVGMRVWLHLMQGDSGLPLFFQIKQATSSVYEEFLEPSRFDNSGQRVVVGQRLMQSASDVFLGHVRADGHDYYVRQFRDMKIIPEGSGVAGYLAEFARGCGRALAKSHARSGEPAAIAGYIGSGRSFGEAMVTYGQAYAAQTVTDHADLVAAAAAGTVEVAEHAW